MQEPRFELRESIPDSKLLVTMQRYMVQVQTGIVIADFNSGAGVSEKQRQETPPRTRESHHSIPRLSQNNDSGTWAGSEYWLSTVQLEMPARAVVDHFKNVPMTVALVMQLST